MRALLTLSLLVTLASCGKQSDLDKLNSRVDDSNARIKALETRVNDAEYAFNSLIGQVNDLEVDHDTLSQSVALNASNLANLQGQFNMLSGRVDDLITVSKIVDPCGDMPNQFDEMLLILSDGTILAYFEQGSKRFLTSIPNGNYRTTDVQACNFQVTDGEIVD